MPDLASSILKLHGVAALAVVFALPALESSVFVGFIFPGEIAVILGGVLAFNHRANLIAVMVAAVAGAILGDTVGYAVGRRWGTRLLEGPLSRFIPSDHLDRAKAYLVKRGGAAVFFGRFTAALRVLVPGLAGMSGVSYARFATFNVLGGTIWAVSFVLLGFAAGASWRKVETAARNAGLLLLGVILVVAAVVVVARWAARHPDRIKARLRWIARVPGVGWTRRRFDRQLAWLARRMRPSEALGLWLTAAVVATLLLGTGFALLAGAVAGGGVERHVDRPVLDWLVRHRDPTFTGGMKAVTALGSSAVLIVLVLAAGGVTWLACRAGRRRWTVRPWLLLAAAWAGAWALSGLMRPLVGRPRPPVSEHLVAVSSWAFPSGHAAQAVAFYGCGAALVATCAARWSAKVGAWAVAFGLTAGIGLSRLYLGVQWLTDVLGGYALGAVWLGLLLMVARVATTVSGRRAIALAGRDGGGRSEVGVEDPRQRD